MIKTVLFDLGNVLIGFSHEQMYRQLAEVCGTTSDKVRETLTATGLYHSMELGEIDANGFVAQLEKEFGRPLDVSAVIHAGTDIFVPITEMERITTELEEQGIRMVLISNTCRAHFEHARAKFPVLRHLSAFTLSFQVGARKPDAKIYHSAQQLIDCRPVECLYVDDIPELVAAGESHGFLGHVFRNPVEFTQCLAGHGVKVN